MAPNFLPPLPSRDRICLLSACIMGSAVPIRRGRGEARPGLSRGLRTPGSFQAGLETHLPLGLAWAGPWGPSPLGKGGPAVPAEVARREQTRLSAAEPNPNRQSPES